MKALVLREPGGPLVLEDVPRPRPGPGEVIVRVKACGLGLTLVWNRNGRRGPGRLPRVIGHEIAGDVVELGDRVERFRPGDRVTVYYYLTCGECRWCKRGRDDLCEDQLGNVGRETDGGLAEYVKLPAHNLCRLPPEVTDVAGAITADAVATSVHVLGSRAATRPGETVLIVGAGGGVGIHMVQVAALLGARVIAADRGEAKLSLAAANGATEVLDATTRALDEEIASLTDGHGVDVVVDLVGSDDTMRQGLASLGRGGRLVLVGSYSPDASLTVAHGTLAGERALLGSSYCTRAELEQAVELVARGRIRPVVTRTCRLDEADAVLGAVERQEVAGRACVILD